jgi:hypothetical protein
MTARTLAVCACTLQVACWTGSAVVEAPTPVPASPQPARTPRVVASSRCSVEHGAPVGGFAGATLRVEPDDDGVIDMITVAGDGSMHARLGMMTTLEVHVAPGVYTLEAVIQGDKVRCTGITLADGQVTTVRVRR